MICFIIMATRMKFCAWRRLCLCGRRNRRLQNIALDTHLKPRVFHDKEALVFQSEWVVQMNDMLYHDLGESRRPNEDEILRVAAPLRKMKPEAYIPQFVSMGPYHHSILEKDIDSSCAESKISTAETCKGKAAARLSQELHKRGKSFKTIVELMEQIRPEIDRFYHWPTGSSTAADQEHSQNFALMKQIRPEIDRFYHWPTGSSTTEDQDSSATEDQEHSKNFALMMAVDSAFLLHFLISLYKSRNARLPPDDHRPSTSSSWSSSSSSSSDDDMIELGPQECIKSDILKLENQIPLFVMEKVFENAKEASIYDGLPEDFNQLLQKTCPELSPFEFEVSDDINLTEVVKDQQPHLLGYLHAFVSPTLQIERETKTPTILQRLKIIILDIPLVLASIFAIPTLFFERKYEIALHAEKLAKAGIKFKLLSRATEKIRFDSWSGTLYLPEINVCEMQTEVLLRNMVALEFNDVARGTTVMRYIGLMDSLIQTPDDVRVLRDHHVIATDTVTDESIAKMWNDLAKPLEKLALDSDDLGGKLSNWQQKLKSKLKSKLKTMLGGLYEKQRELYDKVSNWKFIGLVAATLGLFLTAVQTYVTVWPRNN